MMFTYDKLIDVAILRITDGQYASGRVVDVEMKGATIIVGVDAEGGAVFVEFLNASNQLAPALLAALEEVGPSAPEPDSPN